MEVKKGFVFSFDMLLAILIAVILIAGISFNLLRGQEDLFGNLYLSKVASDALIVLHKNGILETLDATVIKNNLIDILPNNLAFKINIVTYECSNVDCTSFREVSGKNIAIINPDVPEKNSVISKRAFLVFENNRIKYFSTSDLRIWLL